MADFVKGLFGGAKQSVLSAVPSDDFADFASAPAPTAPSHAATSLASAFTAASPTATSKSPFNLFANPAGFSTGIPRPYTKWYRVWERVSIRDFYQEFVMLPLLVIVIAINLWGTRTNRAKAKAWASTHLPMLESEFSVVGYAGKASKVGDAPSNGGLAGSTEVPETMLREKSKHEFLTYCTGRQNTAWLDVKLTLFKRYNPFTWGGETVLGFFFDSFPMPAERIEANLYPFDGREKSLVPGASTKDSAFDGFVFAIVHKDKMKGLRQDRYDISLTTTKDHPKLPEWATVMSESSEITEAMLTDELVKAVKDTGEDLEALIISDQPLEAPKTLDDTTPPKRITLALRFNPKPTSTSLFATFLRLPDHLASTAHFRPEAMRKIRATREDEQKKLRRGVEDEKSEERRLQSEKVKREERERKLSRMSAQEQKKFLDKEREGEMRKREKKQTKRG